MAINQIEDWIARERRKALVKGFLINFTLTAISIFIVYDLLQSWTGAALPALSLGAAGVMLTIGFVLGAVWSRYPHSAGRILIESTHPLLKQNRRAESVPWNKTASAWITFGILILTLVAGWKFTQINLRELFSANGLDSARRLFGALFTPNFSILGEVVAKMIETIFIAFMATLIAVPVAFLASFFCARNLMKGSGASMAVYTILRLIFNFSRSIEPVIWAIIFACWVGIGPFAGMLSLAIHSVASLAKLYSEQIEIIDQGPVEAIEATGANRLQVVWYAIVPQIVLPYLSYTIYRWDINIRMATIIGIIGGGGVGTLLFQYQGLARWNEVGTIVIVVAVVVWAMDVLSAKIRETIA
ncbi:MAG: phosphonate ABC transporter, permease protein PhnE [Planctomycetota bacterium]